MSHTRLYIIQFLGIFVLICGYCLSDEPDSWSVMHIDPNPACPSVFSKSTKTTSNAYALLSQVSAQNNNPCKSETPTHFSFEIILPDNHGYSFHPVNCLIDLFALPEKYNYLFFEEINPPPPKAC